jgi:hypothetical protein
MVVVTTLEFARGGVAGIVGQVCGCVDFVVLWLPVTLCVDERWGCWSCQSVCVYRWEVGLLVMSVRVFVDGR